MGSISIKELTKSIPIGQEWYCPQAPEEVHFWVRKKPWTEDPFREKGFVIEGVRLTASRTLNFSNLKFGSNSPMDLAGMPATGLHKITQRANSVIETRVDSPKDLKEQIDDFEKKYDIHYGNWKVDSLQVYNKAACCGLTYTLQNPDRLGVSLYLREIEMGNKKQLYPALDRHTLNKITKGFVFRVAHCCNLRDESVTTGCALQNKRVLSARKSKGTTTIHLPG